MPLETHAIRTTCPYCSHKFDATINLSDVDNVREGLTICCMCGNLATLRNNKLEHLDSFEEFLFATVLAPKINELRRVLLKQYQLAGFLEIKETLEAYASDELVHSELLDKFNAKPTAEDILAHIHDIVKSVSKANFGLDRGATKKEQP